MNRRNEHIPTPKTSSLIDRVKQALHSTDHPSTDVLWFRWAYRDKIEEWALNVTRLTIVAEEVADRMCDQIAKRLKRYEKREQSQFRKWLKKCVEREVTSIQRASRNKGKCDLLDHDAPTFDLIDTELEALGHSLETTADRIKQLAEAQVKAATSEMSWDIYVALRKNKMPQSEVAKLFNKTENAVRQTAFKIANKLKEIYRTLDERKDFDNAALPKS